ncbi:YitT family protein [Rhodocyclus tenuis]|uniref:YitT family protein n=2 Tax=Rhodocyclus TaxID=1064 RepID=A0A6L5JWD0_RHOTE|nr:YitT family protein [Rhodocyclus gracilis]MQY51102.1 YitT family protein [Rhodocyclus gracilis]MRD72014.1 YitT family protein [Rhodocyclus gracilis]NJA88812.1 YitT family protein [Rhodocyclus gracilis]
MSASPTAQHSLFEDAQAILVAPLLMAFAVLLFRDAGLLTGGTMGIAFLVHYLAGWSMGLVVFVINLPFYIFALRALGTAFTVKSFVAVSLLAIYTELVPHYVEIARLDPLFAALMGGFLAGISLLMLIRHQSSLGGIGVLAIYLQQRHGWRAGHLQMGADALIVGAALILRDPLTVGLSIVGALALNLVIAVNHKAGRYMGC